MTVYIHRHKRTADVQTYYKGYRISQVGSSFYIADDNAQRNVGDTVKGYPSLAAAKAWCDKNPMPGRTGDLATNKSGKPSSDMERRNCIMEVAKQGDCTNATAENYLCLNDWNIQSALRDLKRDRSQGFVVDSVRDGVVRYVRDAEAIRVKKAEFEKAVVGQTMTINGRTAKVKAKHTNGGILGLEVEWQQSATSAYENWKKGEVELEKARQQGSGSQYFRSK